jgi:hypothetical protein
MVRLYTAKALGYSGRTKQQAEIVVPLPSP